MPKRFLASQVKIRNLRMNPPEFSVRLEGRIDGDEEESTVFFNDTDGTDESLLIVRQVLVLLSESYANERAVGLVETKKFYLVALPLDDDGKKIIPPIDINSAAQEKLVTIQGIGDELARRIIEKRPFKSVHDLTIVPGIGEKVLASIRHRIAVGDPPAPTG
jgi:hypothetical protein